MNDEIPAQKEDGKYYWYNPETGVWGDALTDAELAEAGVSNQPTIGATPITDESQVDPLLRTGGSLRAALDEFNATADPNISLSIAQNLLPRLEARWGKSWRQAPPATIRMSFLEELTRFATETF